MLCSRACDSALTGCGGAIAIEQDVSAAATNKTGMDRIATSSENRKQLNAWRA
jgi:hypothetical protein